MIASAVFLSLLSVVSASRFCANKLLPRVAKVGVFVAAYGAGHQFRKFVEDQFFESPDTTQFLKTAWRDSREEDESMEMQFNLESKPALDDSKVRRQLRFLNALDSYTGNSEEIRRLLLEGVDPNSQDYGMKDFFYYAFKYNFPVDLIRYALAKGASKFYHDPETGLMPLDRAIAVKRFDIARVLVRDIGWYSKSFPTLIKVIVSECDDNDFDIQAQYLITEIYVINGRKPNSVDEAEEYLRTANKPNIQKFISDLK